MKTKSLKDVFELRSGSKASYYPTFELNISAKEQPKPTLIGKQTASLEILKRSGSFSGKSNKKLPPLSSPKHSQSSSCSNSSSSSNRANINGSLAQSFDSSVSRETTKLLPNRREPITIIDNFDLSQSSASSTAAQLNQINSYLNGSDPSKLSDLFILPTTDNKKRPPNKIQSIDPNIYRKAISREIDTPVTIDILSESGRFSRQSLDPITNRESLSRFSSRPSSVKDPLFRKLSSGKLKSIKNIENQPIIKMNNSKLDNEQNSSSKINNEPDDTQTDDNTIVDNENNNLNEQDLSEYNYLDDEFYQESEQQINTLNINMLKEETNNTNTNNDPNKSKQNQNDQNNKVIKLDTINESIGELMQSNIRKLNLGEKSAVKSGSNLASKVTTLKPETKKITRPPTVNRQSISNIPKPPSKSTSSTNKSTESAKSITMNCARKQYVDQNRTNFDTTSQKSQCNIPKPILNIPKTTYSRSQNINDKLPAATKPSFNLDLYTPTAPAAAIATTTVGAAGVTSINSKPNSASNNQNQTNSTPLKKIQQQQQQSTINKSNSTNTLLTTSKAIIPTQMDSSRIEKNKKLINEPENTNSNNNTTKPPNQQQMANNLKESLFENLSESIQTTVTTTTTMTTATSRMQSSNDDKTKTNMVTANNNNMVYLDKPNNALKTKLKLELTSNKINLVERPVSSATSLATPHYTSSQGDLSRLSSANLNQTSKTNIGQPTQPIIYAMFEDYPQPFASNSLNEVNNSNNDLIVKKKKTKLQTRKNNRSSSASKSLSSTKLNKTNKNSADITNKSRSKTKTASGQKSTKSTKDNNNKIIISSESNSDLRKTTEESNIYDSTYKSTMQLMSERSNMADIEYDQNKDYDEVISTDSEEEILQASNGLSRSEPDIHSRSGYSNQEQSQNEHKQQQQRQRERQQQQQQETEEADEDDPNEITIKLKRDLVKSMVEKVDAIYKKYDNLITEQENKIDKSNKEEVENLTKQLNEQKKHFSEEMADEIENNINFEDLSSNPELVKRLKEVYALVKQNSTPQSSNQSNQSSNNNKNSNNNNQTNLKPPLPKPKDSFDKNPISKTNEENVPNKNQAASNAEKIASNRIAELNRINNNNLNDDSKKNSIKSNVDIREVFSIVNGFSRNSSFNQRGGGGGGNGIDMAEMTIPPGGYRNNSNRFNSNNSNYQNMNRFYKLPPTLSDKINTLIIPFQKTSDPTIQNSKLDYDVDKQQQQQQDTLVNRSPVYDDESTKFKFKHANLLDSNGNSFASDSNSISYHYDVKYRNDEATSPVTFQIDSENEFQFKWKKGNLIGKGAFGSVYQAMLSTGAIIAVKQIEMEEVDPQKARKEYDGVREEVRILRELDHINIVQFMGTTLEGNTVNIFMELIPGGTIETLLKTYGPFEESLFSNFTNQILEGINYIHSRNVVHRDIKGKNIMVMSNGIVKLIDFGCAKRLKKNQSSDSFKQLLKSLKGTPYWMSPEVIRETGHGSKADIWSTGATIFEMATGSPPWGQLTPIAAIYAIGNDDTPTPQLPDKFSPEAVDFVKQCLIRDPDLRPNASDLLNHPFLKQNA